MVRFVATQPCGQSCLEVDLYLTFLFSFFLLDFTLHFFYLAFFTFSGSEQYV